MDFDNFKIISPGHFLYINNHRKYCSETKAVTKKNNFKGARRVHRGKGYYGFPNNSPRSIRKYGMLLKLYFEKAYDRFHWDFLKMVLLKFIFSSASFVILIYWGPTNFSSTMSLKQGCPLSFHSFLLWSRDLGKNPNQRKTRKKN